MLYGREIICGLPLRSILLLGNTKPQNDWQNSTLEIYLTS